MDRTAATHSKHDEMLIVRLFGGDVDDRERAHAFELLGGCEDCAALFADLGATADATAALAVPARPRDFSLTEADAARLRRPRSRLGFLAALSRTRAFGGALVAAGLVGLVATASLGSLSGGTGTSQLASSNRLAYASSAAVAPAASAAPAAVGAVAPSTAEAPPAATKATEPQSQPSAASDQVASSPPPQAPDPNFGAATNGPVVAANGSDGTTEGAGLQDGVTPAAPTSESGIDARLIWLGGFGVLFLAGLAVLIGPAIRRRRTR
jgi:anti-sigma factor RsiW